MNNEFENRLTKLLDSFVRESIDSNLIKFDYNLITFDNSKIFNINEDVLMDNKNLAIIYSELVNEFMIYYNIDFCVSLNGLQSSYYNSGLSFRKNQDVFFINSKQIVKKSIKGVNRLIQKFGKNEVNTNSTASCILPFIFKPSIDSYKKLILIIKLLSNIVKLDRVFIFSIFELSEHDKSKIKGIVSSFKQDFMEINLIDKSMITNYSIFTHLLDLKIINNDTFDKIDMFLNSETDVSLAKFDKVIQNSLFVKFKDICDKKKSRVCLSLESISDSTEIIKYTNLLGAYIVAIKINSNYIYNESILKGLKRLSVHHNFIIIDDKRITVNSIEDLEKINLFKYVDAISLKFNFMSDKIDEWYSNIRKSENPNASVIFYLENESDRELVSKQYLYFNNIVLGILGLEKSHSEMFSYINYKNVGHLKDNFVSLKNSDIIVLEDELYKSKNPIDIVCKINNIMNT